LRSPGRQLPGFFFGWKGFRVRTVPAQRDYEADLERELEDGDQKLSILPKIIVR
jgi:hypothetical protein